MRTDLITVRQDAPLADATALLMSHRISGLPVVDAGGMLLGIVTEKDLLRVLYEEPGTLRQVADLMTRDPRSFGPDEPLANVCDCLMANHFRRVPVVEGGRLVGLVSRADLMETIYEVIAEQTATP
jgi:CBS domain-containing protein